MGASSTELTEALAAVRAKRKPALTKAEALESAEVRRLQAELDAEYRALRQEENASIVAQYAPTKARQFFDFDPDMVHPATIEHRGHTCTLHSRFVVRHATKTEMEVYDDVKRAVMDANGNAAKLAQIKDAAAESTTEEIGRRCIVYPEPVKDEGSAQHYLDIEASLHYFGYAAGALGNAAARLGGLAALEHQAKS